MLRLLMIIRETKKLNGLVDCLERNGLICSIISYNDSLKENITRQLPDLLFVEMDGNLPDPETKEIIQRLRKERHLPVIALIPGEIVDSIDGQLNADDFAISPYDARELALRSKRLLNKTRSMVSNELIKCDGLVIDLTTCEVTAGGRLVELTFKEYELLKLMAGNRGRVYTREALLDKIWGYDYYGGDRTVDVHIRRLRSKIEDANHSFIETVRNIGYRFRKGDID